MSILFQAYPLARQALFAMDAEAAHEATLHALQKAYDCSLTRALMRDRALAPTRRDRPGPASDQGRRRRSALESG